MRRLSLIAFLAATSFTAMAVAAPVPKEAEGRAAVLRVFGTPSDPNKHAEFAVEGRKLVIKLPKPTPRGAPGRNFPHTARAAEGDFVLQVKLSYPLPEKVPALGAGMCAAGGLYIFADDTNHILFHRGHQPCGLVDGTTRWDTNFFIEYNRPAADSMHHQNGVGKLDAPPVYLRLTRAKGTITPAYSYDGKRWHEQQPGAMKFPEKVTVGAYALQTSDQPAAVTFEDFTVTPIPASEKK